MKKRIGAVLMGVLLSTSLIGTNVFAEETEPPAKSETVFEIVEGATGTYVKGSKKDHVIKVRMSTTAEKIHKVTVDRDDNELDRDNWNDGNSEEVPPTTDAPVPSEAPSPSWAPAVPSEGPSPSEAPAPSWAPAVPSEGPSTSGAPAPTTDAPSPSETPTPATSGAPAPTTDAPSPSETPTPATSEAPARKVKKSSVKSYNILTPINVQAAETETKIVPVTIKGTYLETLSLGKHTVSAYILDAGEEKSVTATINVVAQETTSEAPATSEAPEATTEEDTEDVDDNDEEDTEDESSTTKKDNTTSTKKKTSKKSKSSKTGDNSQIMLYLVIALVSGCAIAYFARKKATK